MASRCTAERAIEAPCSEGARGRSPRARMVGGWAVRPKGGPHLRSRSGGPQLAAVPRRSLIEAPARVPALAASMRAESTQPSRREARMAVDKFAVEASHIMMFARAIGDPNEIYSDEDYAAEHRAGRHHRPAHLRAGQRPVRPRLRPASEDRPALVRLRQGARPASSATGGRRERRRRRTSRRAALRVPPPPQARRRAVGHDRPARPGSQGVEARRQADVPRDHHRVPRPERRTGDHRPRRRRRHREGHR